jgi:DNA mismatch endonuclease, patch repair protein
MPSGTGAGRSYPPAASEARSANMRANRRADTKPEVGVRSALPRLGYRYRKDHRLDLEGGVRVRPDIVFTARKVAVFVDGCFWHACPEHGRQPAVNEWYWAPKLRRTAERDRAADIALAAAGWRVVRLWEHVPLGDATEAVIAVLGRRQRVVPGGGELATPGAGELVTSGAGVPVALADVPVQATRERG